MSKETLEEAAYQDCKKSGFNNTSYAAHCIQSFIKGAEWQQKKMYSEEEVRELLSIQRGNCYVAILSKTNDIELASLTISAPEPKGKDGWVK